MIKSIDGMPSEYHGWVELFTAVMSEQATSTEVIDRFETLMDSIWRFCSRIIGDAGVRAVVSKSIQVASQDVPALGKVRILGAGVDFEQYRQHIAELGYGLPEVTQGLSYLGLMVVRTLSLLAGEALTRPMLQSLQNEEP